MKLFSANQLLCGLFLGLAISFSTALNHGCKNDEDCNLNGVCTHNQCLCDDGWRSSDCGELDIRPASRMSGYNITGQGTSSWGARIVHDSKDFGLFHLFAAEFPGGCGLEHWSPFSRIIRAESRNGPAGPYKFMEEILGAFSHNPTVVYSPVEKLYLLYYIGCPVVLPKKCSLMSFTCGRGNDRNGESGISMLKSFDLSTWTPMGEIFSGGDHGAWDETVTNPSPFVIENPAETDPEILLAYRGCPYNCGLELISLAAAKNHAGPYQRAFDGPIFENENEDPFIWRDKRGNYHMLLHSLEIEGGFGDGPKVGRHAYARSWHGPWIFNEKTTAYTTVAQFTDGSSIEYYRRERPQLFFSEDGEMTPLYLSNGVNEKNTTSTYTLIVPIGRKSEEYEREIIERTRRNSFKGDL